MNALEAKARALQKRESENWNSLPSSIHIAIKEAVNQGRMLCCISNLRKSDAQKLRLLNYKVSHIGGAAYIIEWYHP